MQQKLSHYLDVVEMELVKQTSQRSRSFFAALTQMRDLHGQVAKAVTRIRTSRMCMTAMQDTLVRSGVAIPQLRRRRANMDALHRQLQALEQMQQGESARKVSKALQVSLTCVHTRFSVRAYRRAHRSTPVCRSH